MDRLHLSEFKPNTVETIVWLYPSLGIPSLFDSVL